MFRLDEEISGWCKAVAGHARMSKREVEELRDHLESEVRRQRSLGATDEKAFELAIARLGNIDELSNEYGKNKRVGRLIAAVANVPHGNGILGAWLLAIAGLMSFFHVVAFVEIFLLGADRPTGFANLTVVAFLGYALWSWLPFVWGGAAGVSLLRGRALGPAALFGLVVLVVIQVPVFGAAPLPAFELSGGLQLTLQPGAVEGLFEYQTLPEIHINAPAGEFRYFGINVIALAAFVFTLAKFLDCALRIEAGNQAAAAFD